MKTTALAIGLVVLTTSLCFAVPGVPEQNGLTPASVTFYANTNFYDNGGAESDNLDIAANGNVLIGWEDDGGGIFDFESVWTVFDFNGNILTPWTEQTNRDISGVGGAPTSYLKTTNTYLSFFRSDDTAIPAWTGWGPKIKANKWGDGIGHGAQPWQIGLEIPELLAINVDDGGGDDFPCVQLMNNNGTPMRTGVINGLTNLGIVTVTDADFQPAGAMRIGDWDYLSSGNIVISIENRQNSDLVTRFGGATARRHVAFKIVNPTNSNVEVKSLSLASDSNGDGGNQWHGVGVTANGFALQWECTGPTNPAGPTVRMFDNAGNALTPNLHLATLTGHPEAGTGGRGGGSGFHGNGTDAYVSVVPGDPGNSTNGPWVTVLNTDGTVRWSRKVADDSDPINSTQNSDVDGAIAPDGRVIVVWASPLTNATDSTKIVDTIQARFFSPCGTPLGSRFVVSEWESPTNSAFVNDYGIVSPPDIWSASPRVAWRGGRVAISWVSVNPPFVGLGTIPVIGARTFTVNDVAPATDLTAIKSGGNVVVSWNGGGTLLGSPTVNGPWTPVYQCSPYTVPVGSAIQHYRLVGW